MRKTYLLLAGAGAVLLAACSGDKKTSMNADLKNDLALASSSDGITLANASPNPPQQVVSAIERTTPPARQVAPSTRVRKHKPAPKAPPQLVHTQAPATVVAETEPQPAVQQPAADPTPVSPRPQPAQVTLPSGPSSGGDNGSIGRGSGGSILGTILGAVIRGGIVVGDGDNCDPRSEGHGAINQRLPFPIPGGGRIPGGYPNSGRIPGRIGSGSRIPRF
ncbi:MAG: hypothetical protein ACREMS_07915 [Gemmatimonadaceae bacterium]